MSSKYTFSPMESPNWDELDEHEWTRVEGGELPAPIYIRVAITADGHTAINGLIVGADWPRSEITANSLRSIKVRELLTALFDGFDPTGRFDASEMEESATWGMINDVRMMRLSRVFDESAGARGSMSPDALSEFARVYLHELAVRPKSAMTATAKAMNISRATANRWAAKARSRGLLPDRERD